MLPRIRRSFGTDDLGMNAGEGLDGGEREAREESFVDVVETDVSRSVAKLRPLGIPSRTPYHNQVLLRKQSHTPSGQLELSVDDRETKGSEMILLHQLREMKVDNDGSNRRSLVLLTHSQDLIEAGEVDDLGAGRREEGGRLGVDEVLGGDDVEGRGKFPGVPR